MYQFTFECLIRIISQSDDRDEVLSKIKIKIKINIKIKTDNVKIIFKFHIFTVLMKDHGNMQGGNKVNITGHQLELMLSN